MLTNVIQAGKRKAYESLPETRSPKRLRAALEEIDVLSGTLERRFQEQRDSMNASLTMLRERRTAIEREIYLHPENRAKQRRKFQALMQQVLPVFLYNRVVERGDSKHGVLEDLHVIASDSDDMVPGNVDAYFQLVVAFSKTGVRIFNSERSEDGEIECADFRDVWVPDEEEPCSVEDLWDRAMQLNQFDATRAVASVYLFALYMDPFNTTIEVLASLRDLENGPLSA